MAITSRKLCIDCRLFKTNHNRAPIKPTGTIIKTAHSSVLVGIFLRCILNHEVKKTTKIARPIKIE